MKRLEIEKTVAIRSVFGLSIKCVLKSYITVCAFTAMVEWCGFLDNALLKRITEITALHVGFIKSIGQCASSASMGYLAVCILYYALTASAIATVWLFCNWEFQFERIKQIKQIDRIKSFVGCLGGVALLLAFINLNFEYSYGSPKGNGLLFLMSNTEIGMVFFLSIGMFGLFICVPLSLLYLIIEIVLILKRVEKWIKS